MYEIRQIVETCGLKFASLTFPMYRPLLHGMPPVGRVIAFGAVDNDGPVGLALAGEPGVGISELLSIFVRPEHRRKGLGITLLAALEQSLYARGCTRLQLVYMSGPPSVAYLEQMLAKCGWAPSQVRLKIYRVDPRILSSSCLQRCKIHPPYNILPWHKITDSDFQYLIARQEREHWVPDYLFPRGREACADACTSLALRYGKHIVGWIITHRVTLDTLRYTKLFVEECHQNRGLGIALVREAAERQVAQLGVNCYGTCGIWPHNSRMLKLMTKISAGCSMCESRSTFKLFTSSFCQPIRLPDVNLRYA